jgi:Ca2+-binding RTX toxin-like protein
VARALSGLLIAGPGTDSVSGGTGRDIIDVRDGQRDVPVSCGAGVDTIRIDRAQAPSGCERVVRG